MRISAPYYLYLNTLEKACWEHNIDTPPWLENALKIYSVSDAGWDLFQRAGNNAIPKKIMDGWSRLKPLAKDIELPVEMRMRAEAIFRGLVDLYQLLMDNLEINKEDAQQILNSFGFALGLSTSWFPRNYHDADDAYFNLATIYDDISMNKEDRRLMGIRGRQKMEQQFDRRIVTNAYLNLLRK